MIEMDGTLVKILHSLKSVTDVVKWKTLLERLRWLSTLKIDFESQIHKILWFPLSLLIFGQKSNWYVKQ